MSLTLSVSAQDQNQLPPSTIPNIPPPPGYNPPGQQSGPSGAIKASVDLVVLHVSIADEAGQFVGDLKKGDFRVLENKVETKHFGVQPAKMFR